jgi:hypothetical protein
MVILVNSSYALNLQLGEGNVAEGLRVAEELYYTGARLLKHLEELDGGFVFGYSPQEVFPFGDDNNFFIVAGYYIPNEVETSVKF